MILCLLGTLVVVGGVVALVVALTSKKPAPPPKPSTQADVVDTILAWARGGQRLPDAEVASTLLKAQGIVHSHLGGRTDELLAAAELFGRVHATRPSGAALTGIAECAFQAAYLHDGKYQADAVRRIGPVIAQARELEPNNPDPRALLAIMLIAVGDLPAASDALKGVDSTHWRVGMAMSRLSEHTGNPTIMVKGLRQAMNNGPEERRSSLGNSLAMIYTDLGRYSDALKAFDDAVALRPNNMWAWNNRAQLLAFLGRVREARESNARALAIGQFGAALQAQKNLAAMADDTPARWVERFDSLCAACYQPRQSGQVPCPACGEASAETVLLTPDEQRAWRKKACPTCGAKMLGPAKKCAACAKQPNNGLSVAAPRSGSGEVEGPAR